MTSAPSPLAEPLPWNLVSGDYAKEVTPQFELYAADALRFAGPPAQGRVLDVACGPGTLSLLAAKQATSVDALDFAPDMVALLDARIAEAGVRNVTSRVGDGQALPYADASFDAAFSMFGLLFFPDRHKGLTEMRRTVATGGVAVISSWRPFSEAPLLEALLVALAAELPHLPFGKSKAPMGQPSEVIDEMSAAGFSDVRVEQVQYPFEVPDMASFWATMERTMAPVVLLQNKMGEAWRPVGAKILASLTSRFGPGPQHYFMPALLGIGHAA